MAYPGGHDDEEVRSQECERLLCLRGRDDALMCELFAILPGRGRAEAARARVQKAVLDGL